MRYRCKVCGVEAEIDLSAKKIDVVLVTIKPEFPSFPLHSDCELAKPIEQIDLTKLERVG